MYRMVTNNGKCRDKYQGQMELDFLEDASFLDVLLLVRDYIHKGYRLETHPMTGSIKPNQIPYKSIVVSKGSISKDELWESTILIENSIAVCEKFLKDRPTPVWTKAILEDFQDVDLSLIEGGVKRLL